MNEKTKIIVDFYKDLEHLGPGSSEQTKRALTFVEIATNNPRIADIGCGTGAQTLTLASETNGQIVAIDFLEDFLSSSRNRFDKAGQKVETICCDMSDLPFQKQEFDLIWSEGAIYNIGFENGIRYWSQFLKTNGFLAVTEISWLTENRPTELETYWMNVYPEIDTIENKIGQLGKNGYEIVAHFTLPTSCWTENYYKPIMKKFDNFLKQWNKSEIARTFIDDSKREIELYEKHYKYYGYEFYIARRK